MKILDRTISEKTASLISIIEQSLSKPVVYGFTNPATKDYGYCDYTQPDAYYIYSAGSLFNAAKKNQVNVPFETNLLHELSHLCQIEEGFPYTITKTTPETSKNMEHYNVLGSILCSCILDLNVDSRLKSYGFDSHYFYGQKVINLEKILRKGTDYSKCASEEFLKAALMISSLVLTYKSQKLAEAMQHLLPINEPLLRCVQDMTTGIKKIGYDTADGAFRCLVFVFSATGLFSTHSIVYRGKEYVDLSSVREDFSDIHILK